MNLRDKIDRAAESAGRAVRDEVGQALEKDFEQLLWIEEVDVSDITTFVQALANDDLSLARIYASRVFPRASHAEAAERAIGRALS